MQNRFGCLIVALFLSACGGGGGGLSFSTATLSGKIGGVAWTFADGAVTTNPLHSDQYSFTLYGASQDDPCAVRSDVDLVLVTSPKTVGTHEFGLDTYSATLFDTPSTNLIVSDGDNGVEIVSVEGALVTARLKATYDSNNSVEGTFTATVCSED